VSLFQSNFAGVSPAVKNCCFFPCNYFILRIP
jgi:hypothetical protein